MTEAKGFRNGLPYRIDVQRLIEAFPELPEGKIIEHSELEKLSKAAKGSSRYYGVINSWIKDVRRNRGIYIDWLSGTGVKVLGPVETMDKSRKVVRQKFHQTIRGMGILAYSDRARLDPHGQKEWDHLEICYARQRPMCEIEKKSLRIDVPPVKALPKPKLVVNGK